MWFASFVLFVLLSIWIFLWFCWIKRF